MSFLQEEDLEALKQFVLKKRPHVIAVATGSRDSQSVLEDIKLSMRELEQENQIAPINVEMVDHEVAEIFEKSPRAEVLSFVRFFPMCQGFSSLNKASLSIVAVLCNQTSRGFNSFTFEPSVSRLGFSQR